MSRPSQNLRVTVHLMATSVDTENLASKFTHIFSLPFLSATLGDLQCPIGEGQINETYCTL